MSMLDDARAGMNPEIRPQDDLFGHVNGHWLENEPIPDDRSSWGPFVQLVDTAEEQVKVIIQELASAASDGSRLEDAHKIATLYASFMDEEAIAARGLAPVQPLIDEVTGLRDTRELAAFLGRFERVGGSGLFGSYIDTDDRDSDRYLFNILQGGIGLPDESYYRDDKFADIREKYVAHLTELLTLGRHASPAEAAQTVLALETRLAAGHWERAETRDVQKTYNLLALHELITLAPHFDWRAYAEGLGGSDASIAETCVRQPSYFRHLSAVLDEVPIEQWRDWLLTRVLSSSAPYLTDDFVQNNFEFYGRTLNGTPELRARWKRAVAFVEGSIGEAVGKEYVARHFPPSSKAMMDDLVANLLEAYRQSIARLDWMTDETKERAYEKLATFRPKIGYPDTFRDYSALAVSADDLLGNAHAAAAFESDRQLAKIGAPVDRDEWFMLPQTVNAYYNPGTNEICFPAGILQAVLLARRRPRRELRRHRLGHRPRDRPRLRRPGRAVRRRGQPQRLVDRRRQDRLRGQVEGAGQAVRRLLAPQSARRVRQRLPDGRREHRRPGRPDHRPHGVQDRARRRPDAYDRRHDRLPAALHELGLLLAHQAPQGAGAAVPHHRPALAAGVPGQHRPQPRRVPRGVRDGGRRRALAGPRGARTHLVNPVEPG